MAPGGKRRRSTLGAHTQRCPFAAAGRALFHLLYLIFLNT